jgi:hypothetical protein
VRDLGSSPRPGTNFRGIMKNNTELTQEIVRKLLHYDPETGLLFWRKNSKLAFNTLTQKGYLKGQLYKRTYFSHRIIWLWMTGNWPNEQIDHINHNRKDNRFLNLREVTNKENHKNRKINPRNKTGINGVSWCKRENKWRVQVRNMNKNIHIGYFDTKEEAQRVRKLKNVELNYYKNHGNK